MSLQSTQREARTGRRSDQPTLPTDNTVPNLPENGSPKTFNMLAKRQNFFLDGDDGNNSESNLAGKSLANADRFASPRQSCELLPLPLIKSRLISAHTRNNRYDTPDEVEMKDEEENDISPMPANRKSFRETFSERFRRQDSTPVVVRDFDQIDLDDGKNDLAIPYDGNTSPINSPERSSAGFNNASASTFVTSKFAPDYARKSSQNTFSIRPKKTDTPLDLKDSATFRESIE